MTYLIAGIVLFFGIHSISILALPLRNRLAATNLLGWMGFYSLISLGGMVLISMGYRELRLESIIVYTTPDWLRHINSLLMAPVFVLFLATYFPGRIQAMTKHPQLIAVMLWALGHLLVNGNLADVILFGSFFAWALADMISVQRRPIHPVPGAPALGINDILIVVLGLTLYVVFAFWLHQPLIGVVPFYF